MTPPSTLILVPTEFERARLALPDSWLEERGLQVATCGFGVISASASTMQLLQTLQPQRVLLIGIAGSYSAAKLGIGTAGQFSRVYLDGIGGLGQDRLMTASELGFPVCSLADQDGGQSCFALATATSSRAGPALLTVCATSLDGEIAARRRTSFPACLAEDMEAFAVAFACALRRTPLCVIRGISNLAGEREKSRWQVDSALAAASELARSVIESRWEKERDTQA